MNTDPELRARSAEKRRDSTSSVALDSDPQLLRPKEGRRLLNPLFLVGPLIVAMTALFAPDDVLNRYPSLAAFCSQLIEWLPFLGIHARGSAYPQVMTLTKCTSLVFLPISVAGVWIAVWPIRDEYVVQMRAGIRRPFPWWAVPVALLLVVAIAPMNWLIPGDPSTCKGCTTANRVWLALIEVGAVMGVGMFVAIIPLAIYVRRTLKRLTTRR